MRIWSLHPRYLDAKGMVALWRETLLAKHVLEGKTKGYRNHPQLDRFKASAQPAAAIHHYLQVVHREALHRGYNFDDSKFDPGLQAMKLSVTRGQMEYEFRHLLDKLKVRDPKKYEEIRETAQLEPHPLFHVVDGGVEAWEVIRK